MISDFRVHHIGLATDSLEASRDLYEKLGFSAGATIFDPVQKVNICFLSKENHPLMELIEPKYSDSPVNNFLQKVGTSIYHICYQCSNIDQAIKALKGQKFMVISKIEKAPAIQDNLICFLYHKNVGIIELVEIQNG